MYLDDADVVVLVNRLKERLSEGGSIILRESTVRHGVALAKGEYEAVYRSVNAYRQLLDGGGPFSVDRLKERLSEGGSIILRESTVRHGVALAKGEYEAVYRSVNAYRQLLDGGGPFSVEVRPNYGYASMVTAEALVDLRRRWLPFFPKESAILGALTWWALRGTTPLSLWAMPRVLSRLNIPWPSLQNHFFRLQRVDHGLALVYECPGSAGSAVPCRGGSEAMASTKSSRVSPRYKKKWFYPDFPTHFC